MQGFFVLNTTNSDSGVDVSVMSKFLILQHFKTWGLVFFYQGRMMWEAQRRFYFNLVLNVNCIFVLGIIW